MSDFKKGVIYGFLICVLMYLIVNISTIGYKRLTGEMDYEDKAKAIYNTMTKYYTDDIDKEKMFDGIYTGMVYNTTDQYSRYISAEDFNNFKSQTEGNYCGIGVVTTVDVENENVVIEGVYENSPAQSAGLMTDDIIKKVNDFDVTYATYMDAVERIRGEENTSFNMTIYRPSVNKTMTFKITRKKVVTPTVAHSVIDDNVGYLRITGFEEVTKEQFKKNVSELKGENIKSLVIDLRNNPGGLLTTVTELVDEFLSNGIITYTEDKNGKKQYIYAKDGKWDIPIVVLVNSNSASAAELFTGALKDCSVAKIVGENTYGKGVVQTTFPFRDGSALKITTAKYYTPNGVCIDKVGIAPDYNVVQNENYKLPFVTNEIAGYNLDMDTQLKKAVEILKG